MNLKQLAQSLGLSQTTVSRALNGYPEVREETRQRVAAAAMRANYQPNSRARRLATGRAMTIGHVITTTRKTEMVNPIFADFLAGAGEVYAREDYDLLLSIVPEGQEGRAYRQMAANGSVDGVMVQSPRQDDPRIALLQEIGMPFLVHGRTADSDGFSWLDVSNTAAFEQATRFLLDLGHRRIALINGPEDLDFARRRRAGYDAGLLTKGLMPQAEWMTTGEMTEDYGYRSAHVMLAGRYRPTAILVSSIISAIGVRRAIADRGWIMGREVSVITHDDMLSYLSNDGDEPVFTATRSSIKAAGARCAEILIGLIRTPDAPPVHELWPTELTLGRSTGPVPIL